MKKSESLGLPRSSHPNIPFENLCQPAWPLSSDRRVNNLPVFQSDYSKNWMKKVVGYCEEGKKNKKPL